MNGKLLGGQPPAGQLHLFSSATKASSTQGSETITCVLEGGQCGLGTARCYGAKVRVPAGGRGGGGSWSREMLEVGTKSPKPGGPPSPRDWGPTLSPSPWIGRVFLEQHCTENWSYNQRLNWRNAGSRLSGIKKHLFFQLGMLTTVVRSPACSSCPGSATSLKQPGSAVSLHVFQNACHSFCLHA